MKTYYTKHRCLPVALVAGACLSAPLLFGGTGVITSHAADAQVNSSSGVLSVSRVADSYDYVGGTSGVQSCIVYAFEIPAAIRAVSSLWR